MRAPRSCLYLLLLFSSALGKPLPPPDNLNGELPDFTEYKRDESPPDTYGRWVSKRCNETQLLDERVAWAESGILARAMSQWVPRGNFQNAMDMYLGTQSVDDGTSSGGTNLKLRLENNISRMSKLHSNAQPRLTYTYVYCDEQESPEKDFCQPDMAAYTWNEIGTVWTNHFVVLCPRFFTRPTMKEQLHALQNDRSRAQVVDNLYFNQAYTYFHETWHWTETVSVPRVVDGNKGYGPTNVFDMAMFDNTPASSMNADSYTVAATAMFLMQTFSLAKVPAPYNRGGNNLNQNEIPQPFNSSSFELNGPWPEQPQDVNNANSQPDPAKWQLAEPAKLNPADYTLSSSPSSPGSNWAGLGADAAASCGNKLGLNFPPWFALLDKQAAVAEILFRMRDQACLGGCQSIQGVPGNLMAAKKVSDSGCEFAVKLSSGKELVLFASHSGDNCYKATEKMINTCMTDKNDGNPIYDASWINGPNYGEYYEVGVRTLNDPKGTHPPMTTVPSEHLGYTHVQCKRTDGLPFNAYTINLSGWDDGQYGQTILNKVRECGLSPTAWKYEAGSDAVFADGTKNDHWASFNLVVSNGGCAESKIEQAMGLRGGGLDCPTTKEYFELDLMK